VEDLDVDKLRTIAQEAVGPCERGWKRQSCSDVWIAIALNHFEDHLAITD